MLVIVKKYRSMSGCPDPLSGSRFSKPHSAWPVAKNNWALHAYDKGLECGLQPVTAYFEVAILSSILIY